MVWSVWVCEQEHATHILHAAHLRAECCVFVVETATELTVFRRRQDALTFNTDAARSTEELATHVEVFRRNRSVERLLADLKQHNKHGVSNQ